MTNFIQSARRTFTIELASIGATLDGLDSTSFDHACDLLLATKGRVVVTGMGKSGHIANKIASTLASTGTPAFFLHPAEAAHGDMGMVREDDVVIMLSKSGSSDELFLLLPGLSRIGVPIIAITCAEDSKLANVARESGGAVLMIRCDEEACPHDLAPTASTTASLVIGDALAIALLEAREFSSADFARFHPAGALGRRLTFEVRDLMASGADVPHVGTIATLGEVMLEMSSKRFGATAVTEGKKLAGIITDGDLRRYFQSHETVQTSNVTAAEIMQPAKKIARPDTLAIDALHLMEDTLPKVMQLLVVNGEQELVGILHMHDIVKAGISG
jgi:arabinose-5-phosphate isomerase